jgi:hypothetical protein
MFGIIFEMKRSAQILIVLIVLAEGAAWGVSRRDFGGCWWDCQTPLAVQAMARERTGTPAVD